MAETDPTGRTNVTPPRPDPLTSTTAGAGAADDSLAHPAGPVPARIGKFEIKLLLGEGAFGRVYLGFDPELRRDVAIKQPHRAGLTPEARERFIREARAAANIHHPNVCAIYEVGAEGDLPYIAMRYAAGGTLAGLLDPDGPSLKLRHRVTIAWKLAKGLAAAHAQKVTHRDLKPANVLYDKASREVLITDFGLARIGGHARGTLEGSVFGTPAYMSPEQARGKQDAVGPLSDVYSLGVILYELLTGRVPFTGDSVWMVMKHHCETRPLVPSAVRPGLDPRLDAVCLRALAKAPADRFPSAAAFAEALADHLRAGERSAPADPGAPPVFDLPDPEPEPLRFDPAARMRRGARVVAALVALLCVALIVVTALKPKPAVVEDKTPPPPPGPNAFDQKAEEKAIDALRKLRRELRAATTAATPDIQFWVYDREKKERIEVKEGTELPDAFHVEAVALGKVDWDIERQLAKCFAGLSGPLAVRLRAVGSVTDDTLALLARVPKLEELVLDDTPRVTDAGLAHLARHPGLKKVRLANLNVTGAAGKTLGSLPALTDLELDKALVTDELLAGAKAAGALAHLNCTAANSDRASRLTRAGVEAVGAMKHLRRLTLSSHPVEDAWLAPLHALKPELVELGSTHTTKDGREKLRSALGADCKVAPNP